MTEPTDRLANARKAYETAGSKLADTTRELTMAYLDELRERYDSFTEGQREILVRNLSSVINRVLPGRLEAGTRFSGSPFDPEEAKRIMQEAGVSQPALAKQLGVSDRLVGKYLYDKPPATIKGEKTLKILGWFKERGYNPFEI